MFACISHHKALFGTGEVGLWMQRAGLCLVTARAVRTQHEKEGSVLPPTELMEEIAQKHGRRRNVVCIRDESYTL